MNLKVVEANLQLEPDGPARAARDRRLRGWLMVAAVLASGLLLLRARAARPYERMGDVQGTITPVGLFDVSGGALKWKPWGRPDRVLLPRISGGQPQSWDVQVDGEHALFRHGSTEDPAGQKGSYLLDLKSGAATSLPDLPRSGWLKYPYLYWLEEAKPRSGAPSSGTLCRARLPGKSVERIWSGSTGFARAWTSGGSFFIRGLRGPEGHPILLRSDPTHPASTVLAFEGDRCAQAGSRVYWLEPRPETNDRSLVCWDGDGAPETLAMVERVVGDILSDGEHAYVVQGSPAELKLQLSRVLDDGRMEPLPVKLAPTSRPLFCVDGYLYFVALEMREKWLDWSPRGLINSHVEVIYRARIPGSRDSAAGEPSPDSTQPEGPANGRG